MNNNKTILETLKLQPLTEEEKANRHILGRWYGPIATCTESTRNGRRYNRELWERAIGDELFHEKIANKCLFLELGHPMDREETDMSKVCACIPELPRIIDDDLCACVDILDTPNGRILKTLCDYGFIPGISSRGSGDVMPNNDVDPETFFLDTFDIVAIPAVKKARLSMCESLDQSTIGLKKALTESFNKASEEEKAIMKETLENLDIDIEDSVEEPVRVVSTEDIPWDPETPEETALVEADEITEGLVLTPELETQIKGLISDYADKIECEQLNNGRIATTVFLKDNLKKDPQTCHKEMMGIFAANGFPVSNNVILSDPNRSLMYLHSDDENDIRYPQNLLKEEEETPVAEEAEETPAEESAVEATEETVEKTPEETTEETPEETPEDTDSKEVIVDVTAEDELDINTVKDAIELLQEYDDDIEVKLEPVEIDGKEYPVDGFTAFVDDEGEKPILVLGVNCEESEVASEDTDENTEQETEEETPVETVEKVDDAEESAEDNGDEEVIESLKEMVRQKEALETEVSDLRKAKSVGDAKEKELQEKLQRYRTAFETTSAEAAKVPELEAKVKELTEMLTQSQTDVKTLTEKVNKAQQLKESIEGSKANERRLTEEVSRLAKKSETLEAKLEGQTKVYTEKLEERTKLAKTYKARFIETLTKYIESKAKMLGVAPSEITSRLNESYTLKDVDAVCDQILDSAANFSRLPFGGRTKTSARISESINKPINGVKYEDDDLSDLYELAGLKK